jgi:hypothetical protein
LYISAVYLAPDIGKRAYDLFVEDHVAITDNVTSVTSCWFSVTSICRKSGGRLPKKAAVLRLNVTTDLESDLIAAACLDET